MTQLKLAQWGALLLFVALIFVLCWWQPPATSETNAAVTMPHAARQASIDEQIERQRAYNDRLAPKVLSKIMKAAQQQ